MAYMDTDSYFLAMTDTMDNLVKPELREEWAEVAQTMFVLDENDVDKLREPGIKLVKYRG